MKNLLIIMLLLSACYVRTCQAQVGAKISLLAPGGDIGPTYKKAPAYEIFYVTDYLKGRLRARVGLSYASLTPRMDTFPAYGVNGSTVVPGFAVYDKLTMTSLFVDQNIRLFEVKNFTAYAGVGISVGFAKYSYHRTIETMIIEDNKLNQTVGGLRFNLQAVYTIGNHLQVFAEGLHNAIVVTDWSASFGNNTYGIGINYRFKSN